MGKRKVIAVVDTETCPVAPMGADVDPRRMRVYDVGWVIAEKRGEVLAERSFVVTDWFFNPMEFMTSAYYADKLPAYRQGLGTEWVPAPMLEVWRAFREDCKTYGVEEAWAYNCRFDAVTLDESVREASRGFTRFFLPYGVKWRDIWKLAEVITSTDGYNRWAHGLGLTSEAGIAKTTAEAVYRFITGDSGFEESHTALQDARIEYAILRHLRYRHYATPKTWGGGYRGAMAWSKANGAYVPKSKRG